MCGRRESRVASCPTSSSAAITAVWQHQDGDLTVKTCRRDDEDRERPFMTARPKVAKGLRRLQTLRVQEIPKACWTLAPACH
eukprot:3176640-Pleurochrysis_carterae.AAC.2